MIAWPANTHPARLIARLGVSEAPAAIAVTILAALQYIFLAQLWRGFPLKAVGDVIHINVIVTGLALSLVGTAAIAVVSVLRWHRGTAAARRLEAAASPPTFEWYPQRSCTGVGPVDAERVAPASLHVQERFRARSPRS